MASTLHAVGVAFVAVVFWTALGYPVARRFVAGSLALAFAPTAGWAVHNVLAIPVFLALPWSSPLIAVFAIAILVATWRLFPGSSDASPSTVRIPRTAWVVAALVAATCAAAIVPKTVGDAVHLSSAIFDHSKAAMIDSLSRSGLPPANPFIAHDGNGDRLAYYYLWHFSAAQVARLFGTSGWEADIGMTFFSAWASLIAMMALAVRFSGRASAAWWVPLMAVSASARPVLQRVFGAEALERWVESPGGFQGWYFQSSWVPQHLMSTTCVLLSLLLLAGIDGGARGRSGAARTPVRWSRALILGIVITAGFESSTWVGGIVFAACCACVVPFLLLRAERRRRIAFVSAMLTAALTAIVLAWPFISAQLAAASSRQAHAPIVLQAFSVLGQAWPAPWRSRINPAGFWFALLPIEFVAVYGAGIVMGWQALRREEAGSRAPEMRALAVAALGSFACAWLLVSTLADNNDLGWRAGLMTVVFLIVLAATGAARWTASSTATPWRRRLVAALLWIGVAAGLPDGLDQLGQDVSAEPQADGGAFAAAPALWSRVRDVSQPDERVANNPLALRTMTPWPVNIGWALLADRPSCYSAWELVQVYSSIPHDRLRAIDAQFIRVFAGRAEAGDVAQLAGDYGCAVVVVTPSDGAWRDDPFRDSPWYRLADEATDRWRIYRRRTPGATVVRAARETLADPRTR